MKAFFKRFSEPLSSIRREPYHFAVWCLVTNVVGLAGFWLPLILVLAEGKSAYDSFQSLLNAGVLASFGVVILADGVAATLVVVKGGSNITAAGIRGLTGGFAILFTLVEVGVLVRLAGGTTISFYFQMIVTILSMVLASYLYCFRSPDWEKGVDDVKKEEDQEICQLTQQAVSRQIDDGVRL